MSDRLPTGLLVSALLRRVNDVGGMGMVRARGDHQSGAILLLLHDEQGRRVVERGFGPGGEAALVTAGTQAKQVESDMEREWEDYWPRRRARDPDLWVVELDVPAAERFAAETILDG